MSISECVRSRARVFYDAFLREFGFRGTMQPDGGIVYVRIAHRAVHEAFALILDEAHVANANRLAFTAASREEVDRIAARALAAGATHYEQAGLCPEISATYYAAFFADPDGNAMEVVFRG